MNKDLWKTDDLNWISEREKEWVHVKENLNKMDPTIPRRSQRFHKELFFEGILDPILSDVTAMMRENIAPPFDWYLTLFKMWYIPDPSIEAFKSIFEEETRENTLLAKEHCRSMLFQVFRHSLFTTSYGMFGGREELLVKTFILGYDHKELIKVGREKYTYNLRPKATLQYCAGHTSGLLASGNINPYAPGQYLWDSLSYSIEKYPDEAFKEQYADKMLRTCLRHVHDWDERPDAPKELPNSVALRQKLYERFDARDFSPTLMKFWDEEKIAFENDEPYPE